MTALLQNVGMEAPVWMGSIHTNVCVQGGTVAQTVKEVQTDHLLCVS